VNSHANILQADEKEPNTTNDKILTLIAIQIRTEFTFLLMVSRNTEVVSCGEIC